MLYREWNIKQAEEEKVALMAKELGIGRLLCSVLAGRDIDTPQKAKNLLYPSGQLPDPFTIKDMDKAVQRISQAMENEERIVVFGDYDVDGITATALLYTYLEQHGAEVYYKLPSRSDDGYSITADLVDVFAEQDVQLIITVDGGSSAFEGIARAKELGVDIVVTDHHLPPDNNIDVAAFVNPCRQDDETELNLLSGVGVAFMLACALEGCPPEELMEEFGDLVAVGTVADVMKLVGVNRILVRDGLEVLRQARRPGFAALIEIGGWQAKDLTVENISYGMAPRLNAAGRMDDATDALQLLLAEDNEAAAPLVAGLQEQNTARQKRELEILEMIEAQIEANPQYQRSRLLVVAGEGWHAGIIGIVASRLVDKYAKPVIVISIEDGEGKGSGRSVGGYSLHSAIASCENLLLRFGGHDLAAGLSISPDNIDEFRKNINAWAAENWPISTLPERVADTEAQLGNIKVADIHELDLLAPCGSGNPSPRFYMQNMKLEAVYPISEGKHSRLRFADTSGNSLSAVIFGKGPSELAYKAGDVMELIVSLSVYNAKNDSYISARIIDMRPHGIGDGHVSQSALFESFMMGRNPNEEEKQQLLPERADIEAAYLAVKNGGNIFVNDLRPLFAKLGDIQPGKILTVISVLEEMGLIVAKPESGLYFAPQVNGKKDLSKSEILKRLGA